MVLLSKIASDIAGITIIACSLSGVAIIVLFEVLTTDKSFKGVVNEVVDTLEEISEDTKQKITRFLSKKQSIAVEKN